MKGKVTDMKSLQELQKREKELEDEKREIMNLCPSNMKHLDPEFCTRYNLYLRKLHNLNINLNQVKMRNMNH